MNTTDLTKRKILNLGGKAAVYVRGFMEFCDTFPQTDDGGIPMRKAQEAGLAAVEDLGEEISIPYISKLTNLLISSGVVSRERVGRKYIVKADELYPWLTDHLDSNSWGRSMTAELPIEQVTARSAFLDHMNAQGAVRIKSNEPLAKAAYQVAIDKFKAGTYDMVFVDSGVDLKAYADGDLVKPWVTTHASVGE